MIAWLPSNPMVNVHDIGAALFQKFYYYELSSVACNMKYILGGFY